MPVDMTVAERQRVIRKQCTDWNREYSRGKGIKVLSTAEELSNPYFLRRPSGIMQLDIDTGGGLPAGAVSVISGPDNAGKTFLLNKYMAQQQRLLGNRCGLVLGAVENIPDYFFMRKCGVQIAIPDQMIEERQQWLRDRGMKPYTKDEVKDFKTQVGDILIVRQETGELLFDVLLDMIRSRAYDIIAVDSISAIQAQAEAQITTLEKFPQQAADATLIGRFYKKYYATCTNMLEDKPNCTSILFTSQVRFNRKKSEVAAWNPQMASRMKDFTSGGAYSGRHGKSIEISIWSGKKDSHKVTAGGQAIKIADGKTICWEITKGKAGTHDGITGEVSFDYDTLTDDLRTVVVSGMRLGIIVEKGGLVSMFHASTGEPTVLQNLPGVDDFCREMAEDQKLEMLVRREVLAAAGIQCRYL